MIITSFGFSKSDAIGIYTLNLAHFLNKLYRFETIILSPASLPLVLRLPRLLMKILLIIWGQNNKLLQRFIFMKINQGILCLGAIIQYFKFKPHFIFAQDVIAFNSVKILKRNSKYPVIVLIVHGRFSFEFLKDHREFQSVWAKKIMNEESSAYNTATKIIVVNEYLVSYLKRFLIQEKKICFIPNGIDTNLFRPISKKKARKALNLVDNVKVVLYCGRFHFLKGADFVVQVIQEVIPKHKNLIFLLLGDGPLKYYMKEKLNDFLAVQFIKPQPNSSMPYFYGASDIILFPFRHKGLTRTILESMSCGKYCITTPDPARELLVSDVGGFILPLKKEIWVDTILDLLSKNLPEINEKARNTIVSDYSIEEITKRILKYALE